MSKIQNNITSILTQLHTLADPDNIAGMAKFGINPSGRLGVRVPELRKLAKQIGTDHQLALELWDTVVPEARLLATMVADPARVTPQQMDAWVGDLNSWDICDSACSNLFVKTPFAWDKVAEWAADESEFVRRAGYVLIACLAVHDKTAPDQAFLDTFPIITTGATDSRNFVKKAVNWALRAVGKRNLSLNKATVALSEELLAIDDKTARWIARDALRELKSEKVHTRLHQKENKKSG